MTSILNNSSSWILFGEQERKQIPEYLRRTCKETAIKNSLIQFLEKQSNIIMKRRLQKRKYSPTCTMDLSLSCLQLLANQHDTARQSDCKQQWCG